MVYLLLLLLPITFAEIADYNTVPKGTNPTLYSTEDHVIQLDESTFNDTIFCNGPDCSSYLVEFYSDWCGHCRAFAPLYKRLAQDVKGWQTAVKIAAMNCADSINEVTCRANGVQYFPFIKYFPRNSSDAFAGSKLKAFQSIAEMRDQLTKVVIDDYAVNRFPDWPDFEYLSNTQRYEQLFPESANAQHIAIVFENHQASLTAAQFLLDMIPYRDQIIARRALKNHPIADDLHLTDFPVLAIFKKGSKTPVMVSELRRMLINEIESFISGGSAPRGGAVTAVQMHSRRANRTQQCEENPDVCRPLYFVSEVDMLKAMRYALYRETVRTGAPIQGENLTALYSFLNTLADHFPTTTVVDPVALNETSLDRSTRAVRVFMRLREYIEQRLDKSITIDEWQKEFQAAETEAGNPFPTNAEWDHCKGSTAQFRGYTCGLWTTFHTLTVNAFKQTANSADFHPLPVLQSIRDWVGNYFGCLHCRDHFLRMTTKTFKMETMVRKNEDIFMYLWKAHNIVNNRLKGRDTEDPMFPKYQFPTNFICDNCTLNGEPDESQIHDFLLNYYSQIKPYRGANLIETLTRY